MERSEPTLVPEWLRSTGSVAGSGSSLQHFPSSSTHNGNLDILSELCAFVILLFCFISECCVCTCMNIVSLWPRVSRVKERVLTRFRRIGLWQLFFITSMFFDSP